MRVYEIGDGGRWALLHADVEQACSALPAGLYDAVLCDPPYGLSLMGKRWDCDVPSVALWASVLRCLKPGAPIFAFGGTRTYHRLVVNLEDAGAEIRDQLQWIYGTGFPKSQDAVKAGASNAWQGYGTALKPAYEPIVLARKPLDGTMVANIAAHGCGPLAIDAARIGTEGGGTSCSNRDVRGKCLGHDNAGQSTSGETFHGPDTEGGRWPANVILDKAAGAALDAQSGGASRFFYCAKASKAEREAGLAHLPLVAAHDLVEREEGSAGLNSPRTGAGRSSGRRNSHPTVKPLALLQYLSTLIKPAPGRVTRILVPFAGSGSEMIGALAAGFSEVTGIERDESYLPIAAARLRHRTQDV